MLRFKEFLNETLTLKQHEWVDDELRALTDDQKREREHIHFFLNKFFMSPPPIATKIDNNSFSIPLGDVDRTTENHISSLLSKHGHDITDYINNKAIDNQGRPASIAKLLSKHGHSPEIYSEDSRVKSKTENEISPDTHEIVITRHVPDVIGISSGRNFRSCMTLPYDEKFTEPGDYYHYLINDLVHGTMAAYLVKKGAKQPNKEMDKDDVISRISLKQWLPIKTIKISRMLDDPQYRHDAIEDEPPIFKPITKDYSEKGINFYPRFASTLEKFANDTWKRKDSLDYIKHPDVYSDDDHDYIEKLPKLERSSYSFMPYLTSLQTVNSNPTLKKKSDNLFHHIKLGTALSNDEIFKNASDNGYLTPQHLDAAEESLSKSVLKGDFVHPDEFNIAKKYKFHRKRLQYALDNPLIGYSRDDLAWLQ